MTNTLDVIGLGQSSLDQVARIPKFPPYSGKLAMRTWSEHPGGQIATAVLCCACLDLRTGFIGSVGDDDAGKRSLEPLRKSGVDLSGVVVRPGAPSQRAMILVDESSGERTVLWHRAPELTLVPGDLPEALLDQARLLILDAGDADAALWAAERMRAAGGIVVLDADTPHPGVEPLLAAADYPIVPESFARAYFATPDLHAALRGLASGGARMPVITRGALGACALYEGRVLEAPAFDVPVADTTGAGDVFHGAFAWGLLQGLKPEELLRTANAAAGMSCRFEGAQGGLPSLAGPSAVPERRR